MNLFKRRARTAFKPYWTVAKVSRGAVLRATALRRLPVPLRRRIRTMPVRRRDRTATAYWKQREQQP